MCVGFVCLVFTPNCASFTVFFFCCFSFLPPQCNTVVFVCMCVHLCVIFLLKGQGITEDCVAVKEK